MVALILLEENYQVLEFWYPYLRLKEAGIPTLVVAPEIQEYRSENNYPAKSDLKVVDIDAEKFNILIIPGGKAPSKLKTNEHVLNLVKKFNSLNKPIATICHGAEVLIAANLVKKARISTTAKLEEELSRAGGFFVDEPITVDGNFITSRYPEDLPKFMQTVLSIVNKIQK